MKPLRTFTVVPTLPPELEPLREVAYDLHWAWSHVAIELFRRLDADLWETVGHNPVRMLGSIDQATLGEAAGDAAFLAHLERVVASFREYRRSNSTWFARRHDREGGLVAYFSAEFGLTECLSIFAGGLGILAGDHLKSASDLGVPMVGVGLLYQQGYFRQRLNEAGWQQEIYEDNDFYTLPVAEVTSGDGSPLVVEVPFPGRTVHVKIWKAQVGRVDLCLLDSNLQQNSPADRRITHQLYGGDREMRIMQELVLGIGGIRALRALGLQPVVFHMNEGHSAFLVAERILQLIDEEGLSVEEAQEAAGAGIVFTTHTPVEAGHDYFSPELVERYLAFYIERFGITARRFLAIGRRNPRDDREEICATIVALRSATFTNGVARLHGEVSRRMWQGLWPGLPVDEVPITSITNGVHFESWISREMKELYDRYLGPQWREEPADASVWERAHRIAPEELWRIHGQRRARLVSFARHRLREQLAARGAPQSEVALAGAVLDPHALTIGFARRFATYKRGTLLLRDPDRLAAILNHPERPVQIIYAGKAHPRDDAGKEFIRQIITLARRSDLRRRLVFLQGYDMALARYLVQGADLWLNTPVRPLEASGTSGMKAAANGVLNISTLDGWWDEAFEPQVGWAIGKGEIYEDPEYRDQFEADALYDLLERDVVPLFYERGEDGMPRGWIDRMHASIAGLNHRFNTHRMVREYTERFYLPAAARAAGLLADSAGGARALAAWKVRLTEAWAAVRVLGVDRGPAGGVRVGEPIDVEATVHLGKLDPSDVRVELYLGSVDARGELENCTTVRMEPAGRAGGERRFVAKGVDYTQSGLHGYTVRVLPSHPDLPHPYLPGLIAWADGG